MQRTWVYAHPDKLEAKREARRSLQQWELYRATPDYDPEADPRLRHENVEPAVALGATAKRKGAVREMPGKKIPAKSQPVREVPPKTAAHQ
jgi:hypothetical protein